MPLNRTHYNSYIGGALPQDPLGVREVNSMVYAKTLLFDFTQGGLPNGMTYISTAQPTVSWSNSLLSLAGNASSTNSYPIRVNEPLTGDYLIQMTYRVDIDPSGTNYCSDPSLAVTSYATTSSIPWSWSASTARIAAQANCQTPYLYGNTTYTSSSSGNTLNTNNMWVTIHMEHLPSSSQTTALWTQGYADWDKTGTTLSSVMTVGNSYASAYYVAISADDDADACAIAQLRIVEL